MRRGCLLCMLMAVPAVVLGSHVQMQPNRLEAHAWDLLLCGIAWLHSIPQYQHMTRDL